MDRILNKIAIRVFVLACVLFPMLSNFAQCPMCRMNGEQSNFRNGLNTGILYLLFAPIVLMGGALLYWYFNKRKFSSEG